jgi:hypothetical protein
MLSFENILGAIVILLWGMLLMCCTFPFAICELLRTIKDCVKEYVLRVLTHKKQ